MGTDMMATAPRHRVTRANQLQQRRTGESSCDPFYKSAAWRRLRREILSASYMCEKCGDLTGRKEVHHKMPRRARPDLALDRNNLAVLCKPCHGRETYREVFIEGGGRFTKR